MAVVVNGQQRRIGLALSGGGFRAAAFHLGVSQALDRLGLLHKIDILSCVSGGSIAGGVLALHWQAGKGLAELEAYLRTKSVAVASGPSR
jgi:NTE family protein